jgi:hypothetical protein
VFCQLPGVATTELVNLAPVAPKRKSRHGQASGFPPAPIWVPML